MFFPLDCLFHICYLKGFFFSFLSLISSFHITPLRMFPAGGSVCYCFIRINKALFSLLFLAHSLSVCLVLSLKHTHRYPHQYVYLRQYHSLPVLHQDLALLALPFVPTKKKHTHTLLSRTEPNLDESNMKVFLI